MDTVSLVIGMLVGAALGALGAALAARGALSAARAVAAAHERTLAELREQVKTERTRADQHNADLAHARAELRAMEATTAERERALAELRATFEQSKSALTDAFKATGSDVLKQTAETLLKQAKDQFEGHKQLSQQDLDERKKAIDAVVTPLKEQLAKHEQLVKELSEKREGDSKALGEQLKQIAELQQRASTVAQTLSSAMRDHRQRGRWGEVSLRNVVELAGLSEHADFIEQAVIDGEDGGKLRPDMIVRLPGERFIPIDAKVPMNAFFDSIDPGAASDVDRARRRLDHAAAMRQHVRALMGREYKQVNAKAAGGALDLTVMYVPVESALAAALEADPALHSDALSMKVVITTPATLLPLLRMCAMQWTQARLNENARKIGEEAGTLIDRMATFAEHLQKVGRNLESATRGYNDAVGSFNTRMLPSAQKVAAIAGKADDLPQELPAVSALPRGDVVVG
jgi:DNA recombination protein RmuC